MDYKIKNSSFDLNEIESKIYKYRIEVIIESKINNIILNLDYLDIDGTEKTTVIFLLENEINKEFLETFKFIISNIEKNQDLLDYNLEIFILEFKDFLKNLEELLKTKKQINGSIILEFKKGSFPKKYKFIGKIDNNNINFTSQQLDIEYFKNINYDLFEEKYD